MPRLRPRAVLTTQDLPRTVVATAQGQKVVLDEHTGKPQPETDPGESNYLGRLTAYIPAEIIAAYHTIQGFAASGEGKESAVGVPGATNGMMLVIGLILLAITPVWIGYSTASRSEPVAWHQVINATIGFAIWLLVVGNPIVDQLGAWDPVYGSAAMVIAVIFLFPVVEFVVKRATPATATA